MPAYLLDAEGSDQYPITEPLCKIGSSTSNNIVLTHEHVSPTHLRIESKEGNYFVAMEPGCVQFRKYFLIFDVSNASHNGKPLGHGKVKLTAGDKLQIGTKLFNFVLTAR